MMDVDQIWSIKSLNNSKNTSISTNVAKVKRALTVYQQNLTMFEVNNNNLCLWYDHKYEDMGL
jgi:hypothetical protein